MCGIVGYIGNEDCVGFLVNGLKRVEYRGYDSAGISIFNPEKDDTDIIRSVGKISELEKKISGKLAGNIGIAHTRWATHGEPSEINSHPHVSNDNVISLVHNGIIENYIAIKRSLEKKGYTFYSETDTEILTNLVQEFYDGKNLEQAVRRALFEVKGTYGVAVTSTKEV